MTDPRGNTTRYGYDNADRVISMTNALSQTERYIYNTVGQLYQTVDRRGLTTTLTYDNQQRVKTKQFADGGVMTYTYDFVGRLTNITDTVSGAITRTYDLRDLMTSESTPLGTVGYGYDVYGRLITRSVSGQATMTYTYDAIGRLSAMAQGSSLVGMYYDSQNRPISVSLPLSITVDYGYDGQSRLISMIYKRLGVQFGDLGYGYDNQGRRVRMTGSLARVGLPQTVSGTNYNAANQLTSWNGATLTYDANGNMTSDGASTFTWNARNQLSSMSGATSASFVYDTFGRRISKTVNGVTTQYLYDGDNVAKEIKGGQSASVLAGGTDQIFSRTDAAGQRTMIADGLGSVLGLVDGAGTTTTSYTYDAFGGTTSTGAISENSNQYTSRENDGTGLYFYRARYYQPKVGRFISEDPIRQKGSGMNWFVYTNNNPINLTDPSGLKPRKDDPCPPVDSSQFGITQFYVIPNCRILPFAQSFEKSKLLFSGIAAGTGLVAAIAALAAGGIITIPVAVPIVAVAGLVAASAGAMAFVYDSAATTLRHCYENGQDAVVIIPTIIMVLQGTHFIMIQTPIAQCV